MAVPPNSQRRVPPPRRDATGEREESPDDREPAPYTGRHGAAMRDAFRDLAIELGDDELARRIGAAGIEPFDAARWSVRLNRVRKGSANVAQRRAARELRRWT